MTYLELVQRLAAESGTVAEAQVTDVASTNARIKKLVRWIDSAWRSIQLVHQWRWMRSDFSGETVIGTRFYSGIDLGVASRFGSFIHTGDAREARFSAYLTATGVSDEGGLEYRDYDFFYTYLMRGEQTQRRPNFFTIAPDGTLGLHSIPDAVYTVKGPYRKDIQALSANGDIPEMPTRFHDLIVDVALEFYLDVHDEAAPMIPMHRLRRLPRFSQLEDDQLPAMRIAGPLA